KNEEDTGDKQQTESEQRTHGVDAATDIASDRQLGAAPKQECKNAGNCKNTGGHKTSRCVSAANQRREQQENDSACMEETGDNCPEEERGQTPVEKGNESEPHDPDCGGLTNARHRHIDDQNGKEQDQEAERIRLSFCES